MSTSDQPDRGPAERREGEQEQDSSRLLPAGTEREPSKLIADGAEHDPSRLLPGDSSVEREHELAHEHKYPPHHPAHHWKHTARWLAALLLLVAAYAAGMAIHDRAQERDYDIARAHRMTGGDPAVGRGLLRTYGCAQCHTIAGVDGANGLVGPPLTGIASRVYIAGVLTNTPDHMVRWIMNPKAVDAKTAMPYLGVTEEQARHIAAYLYTLR